jgi:hypothetical protein
VALFTTDTGKIIASISDDYLIDDAFTPEIDMEKLLSDGEYSTLMQINGALYLIGASKSKGYREYKREDGYSNTIIAWVLVPC